MHQETAEILAGLIEFTRQRTRAIAATVSGASRYAILLLALSLSCLAPLGTASASPGCDAIGTTTGTLMTPANGYFEYLLSGGNFAAGDELTLSTSPLTDQTVLTIWALDSGAYVDTTGTPAKLTLPGGSESEFRIEFWDPGHTNQSVTYTLTCKGFGTPTVTGATPGTTQGGLVTLTGTGFTGATAVKFGNYVGSVLTVNSDTSLNVTAPPMPAGSYTVTVTNAAGSGTSATAIYTANAAPTVMSISPDRGPAIGGKTVTISGTGFTGATQVMFGSTPASFTVDSDTQIRATSPVGSGTVGVTVTTPNGMSAPNGGSSFTYIQPPTITAVSPNTGSTAGGTTVSITGTNLTGATQVLFGSTPGVDVTVDSDTQIRATSPAGTGTVGITVTTPGGTSGAGTFTYISPQPVITSVAPGTGPVSGGTSVVINGSSLSGATAVTIGGTNATITSNSATQITATTPAHVAGSVGVIVTTSTGSSAPSAGATFTYVNPPVVSGVSPAEASTAGDSIVTLTGSNFTGVTSVMFGSVAGTNVVLASDTQLSVTVPPPSGRQSACNGHDSVRHLPDNQQRLC